MPMKFEAYFETFLQDGKDILHVCLSSGISGVLNSAMIAKADLEERYPERKILIVDSLGASSGYGLLMDRLADLRDEGKPLEEVYDFAMKNRLKVHHWFFSTDLTFYVRGGRISKASGAIGGLLGICPLLNMDNEGRLIPRFKIRTKKKVIKKIVDQMEENAEGGLSYSGKCYISQSACYEDARAVADLIEERFPNLNGKVEINNIGTTIGSHTGPGTVGIVFSGERTGGLTLLHFYAKTGERKKLCPKWAEPFYYPFIKSFFRFLCFSTICTPAQTPDIPWPLRAYSSQRHPAGRNRVLLKAARFPASYLWQMLRTRSTTISEETALPPAAMHRMAETAEYFPQNTGPAVSGFPRFQTVSDPRPFLNPVLWKTA